jgi:HlyD family secretion protein
MGEIGGQFYCRLGEGVGRRSRAANARKRSNAGPQASVRQSGSRPSSHGVFIVRDNLSFFQPVKVGITGEEHFEILTGLKEGDRIVAGSYQAIRELRDSTRVRNDSSRTGSNR